MNTALEEFKKIKRKCFEKYDGCYITADDEIITICKFIKYRIGMRFAIILELNSEATQINNYVSKFFNNQGPVKQFIFDNKDYKNAIDKFDELIRNEVSK